MKRLGLAALLLGAPGIAAAQVAPTAPSAPGMGVAPLLPNGARAGGAPAAAPADVVTDITPDTAPERSLGTIVSRSGNVHTIDGGRLAGTNLFHSFARFDLGSGDVARWVHGGGDPASITNVVNRVTGGDPSHLFGTIDSTELPNADFFFINPAGIIFGADVQVNVPAAAHFSTASELRFQDGPAFSVAAPDGSTLSVASPEAFGFLGGEGAILVGGSSITMAGGGDISFTASDVRIENALIAGGSIIVAATGGGETPIYLHQVNAFDSPVSGRVEIVDSDLLSVARRYRRGGSIEIAGGPILIERASLQTLAETNELTGDIVIRGTEIAIHDSLFESYGVGDSSPAAIVIDGRNILMTGTRIASEARGSGDAGVVWLGAIGNLTLIGSQISTDSVGSGNGGAVILTADRVGLIDSFVSADSLASGNAGGVYVGARDAELVRSYINSDAYDEGAGGAVIMEVEERLRLEQSYITSDSRGSGDAGEVRVGAGDLELVAESHISSDAYGDGDASLVTIDVPGTVTLAEGSYISSDSAGGGDAGGVLLTAGNVSLAGLSYISSDALGDGQGGIVDLRIADRLTLDRSFISTDVGGAGDAGDLLISAERIELRSGSFISSDTNEGSTGNAGRMLIRAGSLSMTTLSAITSEARGEGHGGLVLIEVRDLLSMENRSNISSRTYGAGSAGVVSISGGAARIVDSWIDSNAFSTGDAGGIGLRFGELSLVNSEISSEAASGGNGGTIAIIVSGDAVIDGSSIVTNTRSSGHAGNISVEAGRLGLVGGSRIASAALPGSTGFSGSVDLIGRDVTVGEGSIVSTGSANSGPAGGIFIQAGRLTVEGDGSAITSENSSGEGGFAGTIVLQTGDARIADGGRIATNSLAGPAGNIFFDMRPGSILTLTGARSPGVLETSSGPGTGGQIIIASPYAIVTHGGSILALGQSGGANVIISTDYFIPSADRLNRVEVDGDLTFANAIYDVSAGTVTPDLSPLDASGILRGQCPSVRSTGALSQLSIRPIGPYGTAAPPAQPGAPPPAQAPSATEGCR